LCERSEARDAFVHCGVTRVYADCFMEGRQSVDAIGLRLTTLADREPPRYWTKG